MKKSQKRWIIIGGILIAIVIVIIAVPKGGRPADTDIQIVELERTTLTNTINIKGMVNSVDAANVYSGLAYQVEEIYVSVGDSVEAGDKLCQLDVSALKLDIASTSAGISQTEASAQHQVDVAEQNLSNAQYNLDQGLNSQVLSAQSSVETARNAVENARIAYERLEENLNKARTKARDAGANLNSANAEYSGAVSNKAATAAALAAAEAALAAAQLAYDNIDPGDDTLLDALNNAQAALGAAQATLVAAQADDSRAAARVSAALADVESAMKENATAEATYQNLLDNYDAARADALRAWQSADANYQSALKQLAATLNAAGQSIQSSENALKSSEIAADNKAQKTNLQKMNKQLQDSTITAPISGTVTAVYAKEGASGSGLLFIIENTAALRIDTAVSEYDVNYVINGMKATVKSDATGEDVYEGFVNKVAPVARKDATGRTINIDGVEFDMEVIVSSIDTQLRIGMSARVSIVLEEKEHVFAVPYDALVVAGNGSDAIFRVREDKNGKSFAELIPITTGMEADFLVEIISPLLKAGDKIITNPGGLVDGQALNFNTKGRSQTNRSDGIVFDISY
jgi:RND family efflux transporter MFP subunit